AVGMAAALSASAIAVRLLPLARSRLILLRTRFGIACGRPIRTPCALHGQRLLRALTDDPPLPLGNRRDHIRDELALRGREIKAEVERDDIEVALARLLQQVAE